MNTESDASRPPRPPSESLAGAGAPPVAAERTIPLWPILVALGVLLALGALTARPAWNSIKHLRAEHFGRQSEDFLRQEQWTLAFERGRSSLQLDPLNPRALRTVARLYSRMELDTAFQYFDSLLTTSAARPEDREDYASLALRLESTNLARLHLELLLEAPSPSARSLVLGAQYSSLAGDRPRALTLARRAAELEPFNPTNSFTLAALLSRSRRIPEREQARQLLWPFARTNGPFRLKALGTLLNAPESPRADREEVLRILTEARERSLEEQIMLLEARANLDPSQSRPIAEEAIRTVRPRTERELRLLVEWLVLRDFRTEALNLMAGERSLRDRGLFLARHRTLMSSGEYQKGYDLLFNPAAPFAPFELEALRCQAAVFLGDVRLRDTHLANAARLAGSEVRRLAGITQLARVCGNLGPAIDAWRALLRVPRTAGIALRQLAALADLQGDTVGARDFARQLALEEPANPAPRLAVAHANLLLNEDVDAAMAEARAQLKTRDDAPEIRAVLALGHLRRNEPAEADLALQGLVIRYETSAAGFLAILAATAAANHQMDVAQRVMDQIPLAALKAEERELLRPIIALESRLVSEQLSR